MSAKIISVALLAVLPLAVATAASGSGEHRSGPEIFADKCVYCHDAKEWGTRVLARRLPKGEAVLTDREMLPAEYTEYVLRHGVGSMPPFTPADLTDTEVKEIAQWLDSERQPRN